jgi:hypothetical protein
MHAYADWGLEYLPRVWHLEQTACPHADFRYSVGVALAVYLFCLPPYVVRGMWQRGADF